MSHRPRIRARRGPHPGPPPAQTLLERAREECRRKKTSFREVDAFVQKELRLIYFILLDYGIVAAAIILLIARYIETLVTFIYIRNQRFFKYSEMLLLCFSIIIVYLFYKMLVIF